MVKQMSPLLLSFLLLGAFWSSPCWGMEREEEQGPKLRGATRGNHPLRLEQALQQTSLRRILSAVTPIKYTGLGENDRLTYVLPVGFDPNKSGMKALQDQIAQHLESILQEKGMQGDENAPVAMTVIFSESISEFIGLLCGGFRQTEGSQYYSQMMGSQYVLDTIAKDENFKTFFELDTKQRFDQQFWYPYLYQLLYQQRDEADKVISVEGMAYLGQLCMAVIYQIVTKACENATNKNLALLGVPEIEAATLAVLPCNKMGERAVAKAEDALKPAAKSEGPVAVQPSP